MIIKDYTHQVHIGYTTLNSVIYPVFACRALDKNGNPHIVYRIGGFMAIDNIMPDIITIKEI